MVKKTRWLACLLIISGIVLFSSPAFAASSSAGNTGFTIWSSKTTTEINKIWTISFNNPLLSSSVNNSTIYVTDSKQKKVGTTAKLSDDGLSVRVLPSGSYVGGDYNLYITSGVSSQSGQKLNGTIIVPFTVTPLIGSNLVVTLNYDVKPSSPSDLSGSLSLIDPNGNSEGPSTSDYANGKYTFNMYTNGDYYLKYYRVSKGILTVQTTKLPKITLPTKGTSTAKTTTLAMPTDAGVVSGKSGTIGGSVTPDETWGIAVEVSNTTSTWTTTTDSDGNFSVLLPTGSYTLSVDSKDNSLYKKHSYKLTVSKGQMSGPLDPVNVEEPIEQLGLKITQPAQDTTSGILNGIDTTTKTIAGSVNSDATVYIYDTVPAAPVLLATAKPDKNNNFSAKLPSKLSGKKLQLKVVDSSGNIYTLDMPSAL
ncbi:hypothetical protein REC12_21655 [Desulfosporosinus sp. PR]|uniref:hypothetical protein n=1 Tax=Candidatus Desulfosporosinus nitrosoreducens TaxID=3401928 RepID=UPI0027FB4F15|nr:hypothetical protein [Desulfosporosinus sp. PR]MDQ7096206.1 hypothetical protein [Desulfosporosinus sp. PR]